MTDLREETESEQADAGEIRAEIDETREEMGGTLNELGDRLDPAHLVTQAKENVRDATIGRVEDTAKGMTDMVMDTIKKNPIPAAIAGAGLALLWANRAPGKDAQVVWNRQDSAAGWRHRDREGRHWDCRLQRRLGGGQRG